MNFFARGRMLKGLYERNKELQSALEHMEEELNLQIEKLQDENEYLKDELAYSRVRSNRLDEEIKTVRERDFKDIYPGLQAENKRLLETVDELREKLVEVLQTKPDSGYTIELVKDEVPTETTPEDS